MHATWFAPAIRFAAPTSVHATLIRDVPQIFVPVSRFVPAMLIVPHAVPVQQDTGIQIDFREPEINNKFSTKWQEQDFPV